MPYKLWLVDKLFLQVVDFEPVAEKIFTSNCKISSTDFFFKDQLTAQTKAAVDFFNTLTPAQIEHVRYYGESQVREEYFCNSVDT